MVEVCRWKQLLRLRQNESSAVKYPPRHWE